MLHVKTILYKRFDQPTFLYSEQPLTENEGKKHSTNSPQQLPLNCLAYP